MHLKTSILLLPLLAALSSCASPPSPPPPDQAVVWGYLKTVPRDGQATGGGGAYGDRRLRDAKLVDYSRPGFAIVYLSPTSARPESADLEIRAGSHSARLEPRFAAASAQGAIRVVNTSGDRHVVSCPKARIVRTLDPGDRLEIPDVASGDYEVFLLDVPHESSQVFVAPGAFDVVNDSGRFELGPITPGTFSLSTWHPRLPPVRSEIVLRAGEALRMDVEIGVGRSGGANDAR